MLFVILFDKIIVIFERGDIFECFWFVCMCVDGGNNWGWLFDWVCLVCMFMCYELNRELKIIEVVR